MSTAAAAPNIRTTMSAGAWGLLLVLSVLWGGTFFFAKIALIALPPLTLVLGRVALAALTLFFILKAFGVPIPATADVWAAFFGMGLLNNVLPFSLIFWGQAHMPKEVAASLAAILNATTPIFGVLVAHALTRDERLNPGKLVGVLLGFVGVAVMIAPRLFGTPASDHLEPPLLGMMSCLTAALVYGFAGIFGRRFKRMGVLPMQAAFGQVAASSLMMVPIALIADRPWSLPIPGLAPIAALVGLAVFSTAVAYVLFFRILEIAGATNLMLVTFLIPVSAILLGYLFLGERLGLVHLAGMLLIGLGLVAIDGRVPARLAPGR